MTGRPSPAQAEAAKGLKAEPDLPPGADGEIADWVNEGGAGGEVRRPATASKKPKGVKPARSNPNSGI